MMSMHRLPPACLPRRRWLRAALAIGLMPTGWAQAERAPLLVEGEAFERQLRVAGVQLQLNGTGVRAVAWFKGCLLYTSRCV